MERGAEMKHTPGPWKIDEAPDLPMGIIQDNEDGLGICTTVSAIIPMSKTTLFAVSVTHSKP